MGKIEKNEDAALVKTENKSKKRKKNMTNNLLDVGDGGFPKEKGRKHREKKRKSESNENGDETQREKGNLEEDNGKLSKKSRKRDSSEIEQSRDDRHAVEGACGPKPRKEMKRKHKHKQKHRGQERKHESDGVFSSIDGNSSSDIEINVTKKNVFGDDNKYSDRGEKKSESKIKKMKKMYDQDSDSKMNEIMFEEPGKEGSEVKKNSKSVEKNVEKPKATGISKSVSFSSNVDVLHSPKKHKTKEDGLVRGKRFTPDEDAIVKNAVFNYIQANNLGDEGLKIVLNCNSHPGMRKCWQEIGTCIPYRPHRSVWQRAHILFERSEQRLWTPEEIKILQEFHKKHGNKWKMLAEQLGKHRFHVSDTWRRINVKNRKKGRWTQEEYQGLYELVNLDLRMKMTTHKEKTSKYGMFRDNIPWTAISDKLSTRSTANCCLKWYHHLTSSMVAEKKWSDADDYRLMGALYELDAACAVDVDWDNLLEHRSGEVCRKRWNQMVMHIRYHGSKPFVEQVDTLAKYYRPDLAETREAWDNKPLVT